MVSELYKLDTTSQDVREAAPLARCLQPTEKLSCPTCLDKEKQDSLCDITGDWLP